MSQRPPSRPRKPSGKPNARGGWSPPGGDGRYWMFGLHAVRAALENPDRTHHRLILSRNAANALGEAAEAAGITPEICDARRFSAPLDPASVHQGAALETDALDWGDVAERCAGARLVLLLDRVTDPHNVGAILRSAEVFGAAAVIAPLRHSAPESGALAKVASGALERQPYMRVRNLSATMAALNEAGMALIGLDGTASGTLDTALAECAPGAGVGLVMGAEGPGMREKTRETCTVLARIDAASDFASLNVSNAAAVALYAASREHRRQIQRLGG